MERSQDVQLGKYTILEKIATGGMAELYMGKITGDQGFEKLVCIKKILPNLISEEGLVQSFIDEAKLAAYLHHENIVQIYDFGKKEDAYLIIMEYLFGKDLRAIMNRAKSMGLPFSLENSLYIISKVCSGLDYAHKLKDFHGRSLNIIHRDISPQNIIVTYDGQVKIIDFGIAKAASKNETTQIGLLKGKVGYMSPEQADGKAIDHRSDIFATGIILYEIVTGKRMYEGEMLEVMSRAKNAEFEPPRSHVKDLPEKLIHVLNKSLEKDVNKRYQSSGEMLEDLSNCIYQLSLRPMALNMGEYMEKLFKEECRVGEMKIRDTAREDSGRGHEYSEVFDVESDMLESFRKNETKDEYEQTVLLGERTSVIRRGRGLILFFLGLITFVVVGFVLLFMQRDNMAVIKMNEGLKAAEAKDFQKALSLFEELVAEEPSMKERIAESYSMVLRKRAVEVLRSDPEKAENLLTMAIELSPDNGEGYLGLGMLYYELEDYPKALENYKKIGRNDPEFAESLMYIGKIYEAEKRLNMAEETYSQLVELAPVFLDEALIRLAMIQEMKGDLDRCVILLKQATIVNPENETARKLLSEISEKLDKQ